MSWNLHSRFAWARALGIALIIAFVGNASPVAAQAPAEPVSVQPIAPAPNRAAIASAAPRPAARKPSRKGGFLMLAGGIAFLAGYAGSAASYGVDYAAGGNLYSPLLCVPIAGPFIALATSDWGRLDSVPLALSVALISFQGLAQAAGAALLIVGGVKHAQSRRSQELARFQFDLAPVRGGLRSGLRLRF